MEAIALRLEAIAFRLEADRMEGDDIFFSFLARLCSFAAGLDESETTSWSSSDPHSVSEQCASRGDDAHNGRASQIPGLSEEFASLKSFAFVMPSVL